MPSEHPAEFLRALLDVSPFGIIALSPAGLVQLWSRGAQDILGWTEPDVIDRVPPAEVKVLFLSSVAEARLVRNDGTPVDVKASTGAWQEGTVTVVTDNGAERRIQDLMEREQHALALVRAERRFRELLDAAPDAIIEVDQDGRILMLNAATERSFG